MYTRIINLCERIGNMKLYVKNVGAIGKAELSLDGITVLAGENNTGKSTLSRALYASVQSFSGMDPKIRVVRRENILSQLTVLLYNSRYPTFVLSEEQVAVADKLLSYEPASLTLDVLKKELLSVLEQVTPSDDKGFLSYDGHGEQRIDKVAGDLRERLALSDENIAEEIDQRIWAAEFHGQVNNVYKPSPGEISLTDGDKTVTLTFNGKTLPARSGSLEPWSAGITFIDDPHAIENARALSDDPWDSRMGSVIRNHNNDLKQKLAISETEGDPVEGIVANKHISSILGSLETLTEGKIVPRHGDFGFQKTGSTAILDFHNISDGKKTFIPLLRLLRNESIKKGDLLILDEPEIHLHPAWQLQFAELLIRLHQEFNLNVLMSTHSPYFLNAIDTYSHKFHAERETRYYLTKRSKQEDRQCYVQEVSDNLEQIYAMLSQPLEKLEKLEEDFDS